MIPKEISKELKSYICKGFTLIKNSEEFTFKEKKQLITTLLSLGAGASWRPIQITHNALELFVLNDFKKPKGLERAHIVPRRETIKILIESDWNGYEWWEWYKDRDYTVLSTRKENRDEANFHNVPKIDIPIEENLFWGKPVGFEYGNSEKKFLVNAARKIGLIK
jgi:hypothetical protein